MNVTNFRRGEKMDIQNLFGTIFNTAMDMKNKPGTNEEVNKVAESSAKSIFKALPNEDILKGMGMPVPTDKISEKTMIDIIKGAIVNVFQGIIAGKVKSVDDAKNLVISSAMKPSNVMGLAGDLLGGLFKK